jgi:hypothetical protein
MTASWSLGLGDARPAGQPRAVTRDELYITWHEVRLGRSWDMIWIDGVGGYCLCNNMGFVELSSWVVLFRPYDWQA